jgi:predicted HAD superfamily Cof-like phosphohydrolase
MRMNSMQAKVKEFHAMYRLSDPLQPQIPDAETQRLRMKLIFEEAHEFQQASVQGDLPAAIKELSDLLYVVLGAANAYGVDIEPFFDEVHRSNMTKLWPDGTVHKDAYGKVLKPPTYSPANIERILTSDSEAAPLRGSRC